MSNGGTKVLVRQEQIDVQDLADSSILALITEGDCSRLSVPQKLAYYKARCDIAGIDYRTTPFQYLTLKGKEVLYALKAATDQLAAKHGIRCEIIDQRTEAEIRIVTVRAICSDGRATDEIGAVPIKGLQGENLANALMKATTKAKRRAILSVVGMGMMDETEVDSIPGAVKPTSDLPWAERASAQGTKANVAFNPAAVDAVLAAVENATDAELAAAMGTRDEDLEVALQASVEVAGGAAPVPTSVLAEGTNLPRSSDVVSEDGAAPSLLLDALEGDLDEPILINEKDRRYFHVCREQGHHPKDSAKEWLRAMYGYSSTSEIHKDQLEDICARLRDPMPL